MAELLLRFAVSPERLVPNAPETPALNERRNELRFLAKNADRTADSFSPHDRWLGWDAGHPETRVRGRATVPPTGTMRAVALGDSFVWGNEGGATSLALFPFLTLPTDRTRVGLRLEAKTRGGQRDAAGSPWSCGARAGCAGDR